MGSKEGGSLPPSQVSTLHPVFTHMAMAIQSLTLLNFSFEIPMSFLKDRAHRLVEQLADDELLDLWAVPAEFYCDCYMLRATQVCKQTLNPGDTLTREEALRLLSR